MITPLLCKQRAPRIVLPLPLVELSLELQQTKPGFGRNIKYRHIDVVSGLHPCCSCVLATCFVASPD